MDEVTEGLKGLDALAKLVVCTIGLFCVPLLTRKYAQNLGLSAGQAIMSKAFYAVNLAGLPQMGMAFKQATQNLAAQGKSLLTAGGKKALVEGERMAKKVMNPSLPPSHPRLQSQLEDQSIKNRMMKERGVLPWTPKDEKKLLKSNNPQEVKALSKQRQEALQFESAWSDMKSLQRVQTQAQGHSSFENKISSPSFRAGSAFQSGSSLSSQTSIPFTRETSKSLRDFQQGGTISEKPMKTSEGRTEREVSFSSRPEIRSARPGFKSGFRSNSSSKPSASDLYARYQQIRNQKQSFKIIAKGETH